MKNSEISGIIYGVRNTITEKWYIGQTVNYKQRKHNHLSSARHNYDRYTFHAAIRKYGEDTFDWTVLESGIKTHDELNEREKFWIREKRSLISENGYNMTAGGDGTPNHPISEETRKRLSIANKGKKHSEETRKRLSIANKGKTYSEETRKRLSIANKGKGSKPVLMFNRNGDFVAEFPSVTAAADHIGVNQGQVSNVLTGKRKSVRGYTFRYKENPDR